MFYVHALDVIFVDVATVTLINPCHLPAIVLVCAAIIFVRVEQRAVKQSLRNTVHVTDQNELLHKKNDDLVAVKKQLQSDEEESVSLAWGTVCGMGCCISGLRVM